MASWQATVADVWHRRDSLGLRVGQVAEAAVLPDPVFAGWEAGGPAAPSQLVRCAPVLQLSEDALLAAAEGARDHRYWPLPAVPPPRWGLPVHVDAGSRSREFIDGR
jgi:hypothetical protein